MSNIRELVRFIDHHTDQGERQTKDSWSDDEFIQNMGIDTLHSFSDSEWKELKIAWKDKSDHWLEALIEILSQVETGDEIEILLDIAECGSSDSSLSAMEHIRSILKERDPVLAEKLKEKEIRIIRSRVNNA